MISTKAAAGKRAGMSKHQVRQATNVANVSADEFAALVEGERPATVTKLAAVGTIRRR